MTWLLGPFGRVLLVGLLFATGLGWGYLKGNSAGQAKVQQAWDKERTQQLERFARNLAAARQREQTLQANVDRIREEKNREIANLNRRHAAAIDGLRNRPERPSGAESRVPQAAGLGPGPNWCDGRQLHRDDAEFLIRLAQMADTTRLQLAACQAAYNSARQALGSSYLTEVQDPVD